jgi:hypothetical protein
MRKEHEALYDMPQQGVVAQLRNLNPVYKEKLAHSIT